LSSEDLYGRRYMTLPLTQWPFVCHRWHVDPVASPVMGHLGTCPPRLPTISFL